MIIFLSIIILIQLGVIINFVISYKKLKKHKETLAGRLLGKNQTQPERMGMTRTSSRRRK